MSEWEPDDFASQMRDGHLFLADEMALKYDIDARKHGWERDADLCGWRSPYMNPWKVINSYADLWVQLPTPSPQ